MSHENEKDNVRYINVSDPSSSGWPAMVKTVREADTNKVDDCKDDIDTLLVFAGLYSAVLSAFIIESYRTLQPDNQEIMVGLMRQFLAQHFSCASNFLDSTTPSPQLPPFKAPVWAIRVNVLWFTSLILSLSAASLGMLVKQWLREYLALEYTTPQQRLRARQYRSPALVEWKVFEIAAALPALLQVSLGLFFLGLCIFTSAVHSSIGSTTIPIVAAWVFFIFTTAVAPLFSPRCPFKTTFLKSTFRIGRRYLVPVSRRSVAFFRRHTHDVIATARRLIPLKFHHAYGALRVILDLSLVWLAKTVDGGETEERSVREVLDEEEDFVKTEQEDVEILASIDSLMADDGLLPTMLDVLQQQAGVDSSSLVKFVLQVIGRRTGQNLPTQDLTFIPDLHALSRRTWTMTTDVIANTLLRYGRSPLGLASPGWVLDAIIILFSHSPHELSKIATQALQVFIAQAQSVPALSGWTLGTRLVRGTSAKDPNLSAKLLRLAKVPDTVFYLGPALLIYYSLLCQDQQHQHLTLSNLLEAHSSPEYQSLYRDVLDDLFELIMSSLLWTISTQKPWAQTIGLYDSAFIVIRHGEQFGRARDATKICLHALQDPTLSPWISRLFASLHVQTRIPAEKEHVYRDAYLSADTQGRDRVFFTMTSEGLEKYCNGACDYGWEQIDFIRLCRLHLRLYFDSDAMRSSQWNGFWIALSKAIHRYHTRKGWTHQTVIRYDGAIALPTADPETLLKDDEIMACECLDILLVHPDSLAEPGLKTIDQIPSNLVESLWLFVPHARLHQYQALKNMVPSYCMHCGHNSAASFPRPMIYPPPPSLP